MSKKRSIILQNMNIDEAKSGNYNLVAVPVYQDSYEQMIKIKGQYEAKIKQYRNLQYHRKLFATARYCSENGIFERITNKWEAVKEAFNFDLDISEMAIRLIRLKYKNDSYSLIYICKWIFLPLETVIKPDGSKSQEISSISFEEMDNILFDEFYNNCLELLSFVMDVNRLELEGNN